MQLGEILAPTTFRLERTLKAPIDRVWSYFVDGDKRSRWFTGGDSFSATGQAFSILFAHRNITNEKPPERSAHMQRGEFVRHRDRQIKALLVGFGGHQAAYIFQHHPNLEVHML